jgi:hypothetical protein
VCPTFQGRRQLSNAVNRILLAATVTDAFVKGLQLKAEPERLNDVMTGTSIFISYRRDDSAGHAGRLYDRLAARFGAERVFQDVDAIEAGADFVETIRARIAASDVVLVLIGPRWLTATEGEGHWRLADENDAVRFEILTALQRNLRLIPVLVQGATMPRARDLPSELAALAHRNAVDLRDTHFDQDAEQLVDSLGPAWRHRLRRWLLRGPVYAGVGLVTLAAMAAWLYPKVIDTPDRARLEIGQMGLAYEADVYVARAKARDVRAVGLFLRAGMQPDAVDRWGNTALAWAAANGDQALARPLLDHGADAGPALTTAAENALLDMVALLLERAPQPEPRVEALRSAARFGHDDVVGVRCSTAALIRTLPALTVPGR